MKAHIFLIANLKFCLQTPCSFGDMAENVKLIGIPINDFLCIYIIASSPGLHTSFCLWRVNKKLPQGETSQNTFQRWRSISWKCKIHMVKWAHLPLTEKKNQFCINQNIENNPEWKTFQRHYAVTVSSQVAKTNYNQIIRDTSALFLHHFVQGFQKQYILKQWSCQYHPAYHTYAKSSADG